MTILAHRMSLDQLKIASTCDMEWKEMQGDGRSRFCRVRSVQMGAIAVPMTTTTNNLEPCPGDTEK